MKYTGFVTVRPLLPVVTMLALGPFVVLPSLALAQEGGRIQGLVTDNTGQAIEEATVIVSKFATSDKIEIQTSDDGRYVRANLPSGLYTVTAAKDQLGGEMFRIRVRDGHTVEVNFALEPGRRVATWLTEAGEREELSRAFSAGVQASRSGAFDQAIDEFRRTVELSPTCLECNYNLAVAYAEVQRLEEAESAFRRVLEVRQDYAAAYYGLSSVYVRQGRESDAADARSAANRLALERLAVGRAEAEDAIARGVTFLDAGNIEDAIGRFEAALDRDPGFAPAHYWMGRSFAQLENPRRARREFRRYLQVDPDGEFADRARQHLSVLER